MKRKKNLQCDFEFSTSEGKRIVCELIKVRAAAQGKTFDALVEESDTCILFYRWRKGIQLGAHFVALHKKDGMVTGYNTYRNSTGPDHYGESLDAFLKKKGYFGAVLIGIQNKENSLK